MTCIIAHRSGWMVADRRATFDGWVGPYNVQKILRARCCPILIGIAGVGGLIPLIQSALRECMTEAGAIECLGALQREREGKEPANLLVLGEGGIWEIDPSGCAYELKSDIWAIGCGSMTALAYIEGWRRGAAGEPRHIGTSHAVEAIEFVSAIHTSVGDGTQVELLDAVTNAKVANMQATILNRRVVYTCTDPRCGLVSEKATPGESTCRHCGAWANRGVVS